MTYLTVGLMLSHSVMPNSLQPYGLWPARLLCPWGFSRQEYWSGLHFLLQEIFPIQGMNPRLICLLHWDSLPPEPLGLVLPGVNLVTPFSWVLGSDGTYGMPGPIFKAWGQHDLHAGKVISLANLSTCQCGESSTQPWILRRGIHWGSLTWWSILMVYATFQKFITVGSLNCRVMMMKMLIVIIILF